MMADFDVLDIFLECSCQSRHKYHLYGKCGYNYIYYLFVCDVVLVAMCVILFTMILLLLLLCSEVCGGVVRCDEVCRCDEG